MPKHEDAAKAVHPKAKNFQPVKRGCFGSDLYGWLFRVPSDSGLVSSYGWVTCAGEVTSDLVTYESDAKSNLRKYVRYQDGVSSGPREGMQ